MIRRLTRNASIGALIGALASTLATSSIAAATGYPVTGAACITFAYAFGLFGGLAGAALEQV